MISQQSLISMKHFEIGYKLFGVDVIAITGSVDIMAITGSIDIIAITGSELVSRCPIWRSAARLPTDCLSEG